MYLQTEIKGLYLHEGVGESQRFPDTPDAVQSQFGGEGGGGKEDKEEEEGGSGRGD